MSYSLIGEDAAISITIGTSEYDNSAWAGASGNYTGICKRFGLKESVQKTNVKSIGDKTVANRYHSWSQSIDVEGFVPSTGPSFAGGGSGGPLSAVGHRCTLTYSALESLASPMIYEGVITDWSTDGSVGAEQSEKITIDLNPDN